MTDKEKEDKAIKGKGKKAKITLPAYGFAEEILGKKTSDNKEVEAFTGPERIFSFADKLKEKQEAETPVLVEEKYETWVVFTLESEHYALPVANVQEMLRATKITRVPDAPYPVRGITNMRGKLLPVVDLRLRLGLKKAKINDKSRILVTESNGRTIGLLVDSVEQVSRFALSAIKPPPKDIVTKKTKYITGIYYLNETPIILLDAYQVLLIYDEPKTK
jgi:purine-binding chemotaxis protein CheW